MVVEVVDDGRGIPREAQVHVFEPFYTTKDIGPGPGSGWLSCGASSPIMEARSLSSQSLGRHASR